MRYLFLLLLCFIPQLVFAQSLPGGGNLFSPTPGDLSIQYLSDIFGVVDGVLHGSGSQILGTVFGVFNAAVLTLGGIIIMYTLFVGTLRTAHEGEVMGKQWSSMWIPIRSVVGFALILPKASGYSFIQIFIMWIVVQGVGAADSVWQAAVNYIVRGGVLVQPSGTLSSANQPLVGIAGNVMKMQTCMYSLQNVLNYYYQPNNTTLNVIVPDLVSKVGVAGNNSGATPPCISPTDTRSACVNANTGKQYIDTGGVLAFPGHSNVSVSGANNPDLYGACGSISWTFTNDGGGGATGSTSLNVQNKSALSQIGGDLIAGFVPGFGGSNAWQNMETTTTVNSQVANAAGLGASDSRSLAMQQIVDDTQPMAMSLANILVPQPSPDLQPTTTQTVAQQLTAWSLANANGLVGAATDYYAIMQPYLNNKAGVQQQQAIWTLEGSTQQGWIMAGSYYAYLSEISQNASSLNEDFTTISLVPGGAVGHGGGTSGLGYGCFDSANNFTNYQAGNFEWNSALVPADDPSCKGSAPPGVGLEQNSAYPPSVTKESAYANPPTPDTNIVDSYIASEWANYGAAMGSSGGTGNDVLNPADITMMVPGLALLVPPATPMGVMWGLMMGMMGDIIDNVNKLTDKNIDPIAQISTLGSIILTWVQVIWVTGTIAAAATAFGVSLIPCGIGAGMATSVTTAVLVFMPMLMAVLLSLVASAAMMDYYVPLIPFIIFLFTAIGWFIAVAEAMVVAPLVALGIAHPEGHEIMGKADPAVILIANIFLRPTLMIIGFLLAGILSHVALWLLSQGVAIVIPGPGSIIGITMILMIFVGIVLEIINRSFALIYEIPNKWPRWLGSAEMSYGEAESARAVHGAAEAGAQQISSGMKGAYDQMTKMGQESEEGQASIKDFKDRLKGKKETETGVQGKPNK